MRQQVRHCHGNQRKNQGNVLAGHFVDHNEWRIFNAREGGGFSGAPNSYERQK